MCLRRKEGKIRNRGERGRDRKLSYPRWMDPGNNQGTPRPEICNCWQMGRCGVTVTMRKRAVLTIGISKSRTSESLHKLSPEGKTLQQPVEGSPALSMLSMDSNLRCSQSYITCAVRKSGRTTRKEMNQEKERNSERAHPRRRTSCPPAGPGTLPPRSRSFPPSRSQGLFSSSGAGR